MKKRTKVCGNANVVGRRIEELRLEKGIRQNTFIAKLQASGLDINPTSYSKLEGQFRSASDVEIYHIAKELGVHVKLFSVIITPKADRFYCRIFLNAAANFFETKCDEKFGNILTFINKRYKIESETKGNS